MKGAERIRSIRITLACLIVAALTAWSVCASEAQARTRCHSRACLERVAMHRCSQTAPRWCVERAIITYRLTGWQSAWMRRVYICESGGNPYARNPSGSSGLYQFLPSTWATTRYAGRDIFSAKWNALAAAQWVRDGRTREWVCS